MRRRAKSSHKGEVKDIPDIGDIFCSDRKFRTLRRYLSEGRSDAEGVVFNIKLGTAYLIALDNFSGGLTDRLPQEIIVQSNLGGDFISKNFNDFNETNFNHPQNGKGYTEYLAEFTSPTPEHILYKINNYETLNISQGSWYIPAIQELYEIWKRKGLLITVLDSISDGEWTSFFNTTISTVTSQLDFASHLIACDSKTGILNSSDPSNTDLTSVAITRIDFAPSIHIGDIYIGDGVFTDIEEYVSGELGIVYHIDSNYIYVANLRRDTYHSGPCSTYGLNFDTFANGRDMAPKFNKISGIEDTLSIIEYETLDSELGIVNIFKSEKYGFPACAASIGDLAGVFYNFLEILPIMLALNIPIGNRSFVATNEFNDYEFTGIFVGFDTRNKPPFYPFGVFVREYANVSKSRSYLEFLPVIPIPHSLVKL